MLIIFDWDGTLSDSTAKIIRCIQKASTQCGLREPEDDQIRMLIGLGLKEVIEALFPNQSPAEQLRFKDTYSNIFVADAEVSPLFPGALDAIQTLTQNHHTLAVATGKSRKGLNRVLSGLELNHHFKATRCADETASKPNPQMLKELLTETGFSAENSIMIGDTTFDMDMAKALHIPSIAVTYGAHTRKQLELSQPDVFINDIRELVAMIESFI